MATLTIEQYKYKPTAPRSVRTAHSKTHAEEVSILKNSYHTEMSNASPGTLRPMAAVNDHRGFESKIQGAGNIDGRSDELNDDETDYDDFDGLFGENNNDNDLPTPQEVQSPQWEEQDFTIEDRGPNETSRVENVVSKEKDVSSNLNDPIVLTDEEDSSDYLSDSEVEVNDFSNDSEGEVDGGTTRENTVDPNAPAPFGPNGDSSEDEGQQQDRNDVAVTFTAKRANVASSNSFKDEEPNDTDGKRRRIKRPSIFYDDLVRKKSKHGPQHRLHSSKSPSLLSSEVATVFRSDSRSLSLAPLTQCAMDTDVSLDCCNLNLVDGFTPPMLTKFTLRPHTLHRSFFTAEIRVSCIERGVTLSQIPRLIKSIGHQVEIDHFTIKPMDKHTLLLTGFNRHTLSPSSPDGGTIPTAEAGLVHGNTPHTRPQEGRAVKVKALTSQKKKPSMFADDSEDEQGRPNRSKYNPWTHDELQYLLASQKGGDTWHQTFRKLPGRTPGAVRTRWHMIWANTKHKPQGQGRRHAVRGRLGD